MNANQIPQKDDELLESLRKNDLFMSKQNSLLDPKNISTDKVNKEKFEDYQNKKSLHLNANKSPEANDLDSYDRFYNKNMKKIVATTMIFSAAIGFSIAGPLGALAFAAAGFVLGLCIASISALAHKRLTDYSSSEKSTNSPTQNMPFLNNLRQNNNQLNESTSGLPIPT